MWEIEGVRSNSTALSASNLTVQRWCPSGTSEQAKATSLASKVPSNLISRGGFSLTLLSSAASRPSSTNRFFKFSTVRVVTPSALATSKTCQAGPDGLVSHNNVPGRV